MVILLYIVMLVFPAAAVRVRRTRGRRALWILTGLAVIATLGLAGWGASKPGGNRLVETYGYAHTLSSVMHFLVPAMLLPVLAAAGVAATTRTDTHPAIAYSLAVLVTLLVVVSGILIMALKLI
jgi:uncharacterized membrane protein YhaH (DUF805 family)